MERGAGVGGELRARGSRGQELGARRGQGSQPGSDDLPISRPPLGSGHFGGGGNGASSCTFPASCSSTEPRQEGVRP